MVLRPKRCEKVVARGRTQIIQIWQSSRAERESRGSFWSFAWTWSARGDLFLLDLDVAGSDFAADPSYFSGSYTTSLEP